MAGAPADRETGVIGDEGGRIEYEDTKDGLITVLVAENDGGISRCWGGVNDLLVKGCGGPGVTDSVVQRGTLEASSTPSALAVSLIFCTISSNSSMVLCDGVTGSSANGSTGICTWRTSWLYGIGGMFSKSESNR
jgi:hypothetical protein